MFLRIHAVFLAIVGIVILLTSNHITNWLLSFVPERHIYKKPLSRKLFFFWPTCLIGFMCIGFAIWISISGPSTESMKSDKNRLSLLEEGVIIKAQVVSVRYQSLAPSGWKIIYKFSLTHPTSGKPQTYWGSSKGPKYYYSELSEGNSVQVIYLPANPNINSEIQCFVNNPSYRNTFKDAGKLELLNRFKNYSEIKQYSFKEWYKLQREK